MSRTLRVAVGQISSESNHFVSSRCDLEFFRSTGYLCEGDEVFDLLPVDNEMGGILDTLARAGDVEVVPLLATRGNSSGPLTRACYGELREQLLERLRSAGRVDGVILSHHGSMAAEDQDDPEGDIASAVRDLIGPARPLAMTLDLHGNVTARMVAATDIIVGYEHYPHDDARRTGERAARLTVEALRGDIEPFSAQVKLPMLLTAFRASTLGDGPFAQLERAARQVEAAPGILSASMFFVGSYIDVPEIGCSSVVVADGNARQAAAGARDLAGQFWARRQEFVVETLSVGQAICRGRRIQGGPVLLLDTADTTGGGAAGDGIGLVRGLLEVGVQEPCLAMVVDPEAVERCGEVAPGQQIDLELGHRLDPRWGEPFRVTARVRHLFDGRFQYQGGILGGAWASMGPSAVLEIGPVLLLVSSRPTYDWAYEQYEAAGLDPRQVKFVGVKNMMNFRFGYGDIMKGYVVLDLPGPTPADMRALPFARVPRPLFPFDEDLEEPELKMSFSRRP